MIILPINAKFMTMAVSCLSLSPEQKQQLIMAAATKGKSEGISKGMTAGAATKSIAKSKMFSKKLFSGSMQSRGISSIHVSNSYTKTYDF